MMMYITTTKVKLTSVIEEEEKGEKLGIFVSHFVQISDPHLFGTET